MHSRSVPARLVQGLQWRHEVNTLRSINGCRVHGIKVQIQVRFLCVLQLRHAPLERGIQAAVYLVLQPAQHCRPGQAPGRRIQRYPAASMHRRSPVMEPQAPLRMQPRSQSVCSRFSPLFCSSQCSKTRCHTVDFPEQMPKICINM